MALGTHPFGDSWPVSIENPYDRAALTRIELCSASLSVSGNTPLNPRHIINPRTGGYIQGDRMVAVVSDDPADAEALTTAWIASGEEREPEWMRRFNVMNTYKIR